MNENHIYRDVSEALPALLFNLDRRGADLGSRAGRVKELTHIGITLKEPWRREVLCEYRKPHLAAQIAETMWVLAGRDDMAFLSLYLPRAANFSDDGESWRAGYGKRLRHWAGHYAETGVVDQLKYVVDTLKKDPSSRQAVMSIWDAAIDTEPGKDIPCNNWLSFSSRLGYLDLHVAIRSNDAIWGWSGINAFEWSTLQEIVAGLLGLKIGSLHFSTTSFHMYETHWEKARKIWEHAQMTVPVVDPQESPRFDAHHDDFLGDRMTLEGFDSLLRRWFEIEEDIRNDRSSVDDAIEGFGEPMLQSYLRVLRWWWTGDTKHLRPLTGTPLGRACEMSVQPKRDELKIAPGRVMEVGPSYMLGTHNGLPIKTVAYDPSGSSDFIAFAVATHTEKHEAYGDSWKKRGEMFSIIPNIARKVDRLGNGETQDETSADTAMDLMVYLAKYRHWLSGEEARKDDTIDEPNRILFSVDNPLNDWSQTTAQASEDLEGYLKDGFEELMARILDDKPRFELVNDMLVVAYVLARRLWEAEQPKITKTDVIDLATKMVTQFKADAVREALKTVGHIRVSDVPDSQLAELYAALSAADAQSSRGA